MVVSRFQGSPAASLDTPMAPQGLVCHICGRQYFKDSMPIHLEQCLPLVVELEALFQMDGHAVLKVLPAADVAHEALRGHGCVQGCRRAALEA